MPSVYERLHRLGGAHRMYRLEGTSRTDAALLRGRVRLGCELPLGLDLSEELEHLLLGVEAPAVKGDGYASSVGYSQSAYPSLAAHVSQAQNSGLPGATFAAPLNRLRDATAINANRNLACGDAPSIAGFSCDEYPLASSYQGLSTGGGTRRSFDGCQIFAPVETGPTGVSACMITASENSAQGGLMAGFYYDWRVLDGDPYRVRVVS